MTANDDRARFEVLYGAHREDLLRYFLRRTEPADAADLLAETFLVAWRRMDAVPDTPAARLWLFGVARNQLANHRRAERSRGDVAAMLAATLRSSAAEAADISTSVAVHAALRKLNPPDRETMMLAVFEELTPTEIAEVTGRSVASIRVRLHRVRRRLARELADQGVLDDPASTRVPVPALSGEV